MRRLLIIGLALSVVFLATFGIGVAAGFLQAEPLTDWLEAQHDAPGGRWVIAATIIALLAADIVLGIPATPLMIAAGALLGPWWGGAASGIGATLAGVIGYFACRGLGRGYYDKHIAGEQATRAQTLFDRYGLLALVLVRGLPILPEVLACLAGLSRLSAWRFVAMFALVTVPWAILHAIAGDLSDWAQPWPAVIVLIGLPALAWTIGWRTWRRARRGHHR